MKSNTKRELCEDIQALRNLEEDPTLVKLDQMLGEFDALDFLGISGSEEMHSKILAWLLNPQASHAMGETFLRNFLRKTNAVTPEDFEKIDWSATDVHREWLNVVDGQRGFLDILVLNGGARFLCAIENKVFSIEHSEQLTRYRKALEKQFGNFYKNYVFLTRHGVSPGQAMEQGFWKSVDYEAILDLVNEAIDSDIATANDDVVSFLKQYATTLRRVIVPNTELTRMANRLYFKHKKAINLIIDKREAHLTELRRICSKAIERQGIWELVGERDRGRLLGFSYRAWRQWAVFKTGTSLSKPDPCDLVLLDFDFREEGVVTLLLTIMEGEREDVRKSLFEKTAGHFPEIFDHKGDSKGGSYRLNTIRLFKSEPILSESDFTEMDPTSWDKAINSWIEGFAEKEFPRMNRIILESLHEIESVLGSKPPVSPINMKAGKGN